MSVVTDAVKQWKSRLAELEQQIAPLVEEANELREAIAKVEGTLAPTPARRGRTRTKRASVAALATKPRGPSRASNGRTPRGQNRQRILEAIKTDAKTAGEIAAETGIRRGTVATTLTKLVSDGAAAKAARGYTAA
jgi:predicted Rossmann fold nucleotide-binding protein DprA/Smf involved in DNA uptake